jgi:hypothetical protein
MASLTLAMTRSGVLLPSWLRRKKERQRAMRDYFSFSLMRVNPCGSYVKSRRAFIGLQLVVNGDESLIDHRRKAKSGRWILDDEIALIDRSGSRLDGENPLWVGLVYKISL